MYNILKELFWKENDLKMPHYSGVTVPPQSTMNHNRLF